MMFQFSMYPTSLSRYPNHNSNITNLFHAIEAKAEYLYLCFIFINSSTLTHHKEIFIKEYITKEERGTPRITTIVQLLSWESWFYHLKEEDYPE